MTAFRVARNYYAVYQSRPVAFAEGAVVDVDDVTADWVNRDSPGCLVPTDDTPVHVAEAPAEDADPELADPVTAEDAEAPADAGTTGDDQADDAEAPADAGTTGDDRADEPAPKRGRRASA